MDPLTAVIVGFLICKTAWDIFRDTTHHLTDGYDEKKIDLYKETVLAVKGVEGVKDIRARSYGSNTSVDIILFVEADLDLLRAHEISTRVENELKLVHDISYVHVHVEPSIENEAIQNNREL